jgi:hypothetical protein
MVTFEPRLPALGVWSGLFWTPGVQKDFGGPGNNGAKVDAKTLSNTLGEIFTLAVETLVVRNSQDFSV